MRQALMALMVLGACTPSQRPEALQAVHPTLAQAEKLAAANPELARALAPATKPWTVEPERLAREEGRLSVRLPSEVKAAFSLGLESASVSFTPETASSSRAVQHRGRVLYEQAWPSTDAIFTTGAERMEWFLLLRDENAPAQFAWKLSGAEAASDDAGGLILGGRLHLPRPFALDAKGERREARLTFEQGRLVVALDTKGLTFPVLLDPLVYVLAWELRSNALTRTGGAVAFDTVRGVTVSFGGYDGTGAATGTTHTWDGTSWTQVATTGPGATALHAMVWDSARNVIVLHSDQTYTWDGTSWEAKPGAGPGPRSSAAMAFDGARGRAVLFGGMGASGLLSETWEWDGTSWSQLTTSTAPSARVEHAMSFDSARNRVVLYGGRTSPTNVLEDTWEWDGTTWTNVQVTGPGPRANPALVFDRSRNRTVLHGGFDGTNAQATTWEYDGTAWTETTATGPSARSNSKATFDSLRGRIVLLGGSSASGSALSETWESYLRLSCTASEDCVPSDPCHAATCTNGFCVESVRPDGSACEDGNGCTQNEACLSGACVGGSPVVCSALSPCHMAGVCDPDTGACSNPVQPDGSFCEDGRFCTTGDRCVEGVCTPTASTCACSANADCEQGCTTGFCDPLMGTCMQTGTKADGALCDDSNACTQQDVCESGACLGTNPVVCGAAPECRQGTGVCDPSSGDCEYAAKPDGSSCDDGDLCTQSDVCSSGSCLGTNPVTCGPAPDDCHETTVCMPSTGQCVAPAKPDGSVCDDGRACTTGEACNAGVCTPQTSTCMCSSDADCVASDQCHEAGTCDVATGVCSTPAKVDGSPCDDGDACTMADTCLSGACVPGAAMCSDGGMGGGAGGGAGGGGAEGGGSGGSGGGAEGGGTGGSGGGAEGGGSGGGAEDGGTGGSGGGAEGGGSGGGAEGGGSGGSGGGSAVGGGSGGGDPMPAGCGCTSGTEFTVILLALAFVRSRRAVPLSSRGSARGAGG